MAQKQKYYVVWQGRQKGIFRTWEKCKEQVFEFQGALYKAFDNAIEAEAAFRSSNPKSFFEQKVINFDTLELSKHPILDSISVDGAWDTHTLIAEYKGVHTQTKKILFKYGPYQDGTNNVVEFLAIVHALAYCKDNRLTLPIYSDSQIAIGWVSQKRLGTRLIPTSKNVLLFEHLQKALEWLKNNAYPNPILKWQTKTWGENPADFGRK